MSRSLPLPAPAANRLDMKFETSLIRGTLVQRYKRFLADVKLDDGREVTAHCANPGAMLGLKEPGLEVWLEPSSDPKRKLKFSWRLAALEGGIWAGIDTSLPNKIVKEALAARKIAPVADYQTIRPEVKYREASRVDFLLTDPALPDCYLEVKNVHLSRRPGHAEFPDSVTARGAKHLDDLAAMAQAGHRAVLLFVVQMTGIKTMSLAADIDPVYAEKFTQALAAGMEVLVYDCAISTEAITLASPLEFRA